MYILNVMELSATAKGSAVLLKLGAFAHEFATPSK